MTERVHIYGAHNIFWSNVLSLLVKKGTFGQENFQVISHASETEQKKCRKKRIFMSNVKSHPTPFPENISKLRV